MHNVLSHTSNSDLYQSPTCYPEQLDPAGKLLKFCRMSADSYRSSPFLDHRIIKSGSWSETVPLDTLPDIHELPDRHPVKYIFHSAYCCSTLLTRYLDNIRIGLCLREPHSLYEAASIHRFRGTGILPELPPSLWERSFRFIEFLLARRYNAADNVFIKPSDGANNLALDLLATKPGNKGIFLYSTLERFLVSTLKWENRHEWARIRARELSLDHMRRTGRPLADPSTLNLPQTAALVWIEHISTCRRIADSTVGEKLAVVDSQALMEQPVNVVVNILSHFDISVERDRVAAAVNAPDLGHHSKDNDVAYSKELRESQFQESRNQLRDAVDHAIKWAENIVGKDTIHAPLPRQLHT